MRKRLFTTITALLAGTGLSLGQEPAPPKALEKPAPSTTVTAPAVTRPQPAPTVAPVVGYDQFDDGGVFDPSRRRTFDDSPNSRPYRMWASAEYLLWALDSFPAPPTTLMIPQTNTPTISATSTTSFSGNQFELPWQSGVRGSIGFWTDDCQTCGIEAVYFQLGSVSTNLTGTGVSDATFQFPFTQIVTPGQGQPNTFVGTNGTFPGAITTSAISTVSSQLLGGELNAYYRLPSTFADRLHILTGFRHVELDENLDLADNITVQRASGPTIVNTSVQVSVPTTPAFSRATDLTIATVQTNDTVRTHNGYYGWQVGGSFDAWCGHLFFEGFAKAGFGLMHQSVNVFGQTVTNSFNYDTTVPAAGFPPIVTPPAGTAVPVTTVQQGGLLSGPLSVGHHSRDIVAFTPELNVRAGYQFTPNIRFFIGYNFLYLSSVVRPGDQVGASTTSGTLRFLQNQTGFQSTQPTFRFNASDTYAHGVLGGLQIRY